MNKTLGTQQPENLNQEEIENLDRLRTSKVIETVI